MEHLSLSCYLTKPHTHTHYSRWVLHLASSPLHHQLVALPAALQQYNGRRAGSVSRKQPLYRIVPALPAHARWRHRSRPADRSRASTHTHIPPTKGSVADPRARRDGGAGLCCEEREKERCNPRAGQPPAFRAILLCLSLSLAHARVCARAVKWRTRSDRLARHAERPSIVFLASEACRDAYRPPGAIGGVGGSRRVSARPCPN